MSAMHTEEGHHELRPSSGSLHPGKQVAKRRAGDGIRPVRVLYGHALAIAHEAIARYRELAAYCADHGDDAVADLFSRIEELEAEHALSLEKLTVGMALPKLAPGEYAWLDSGPPLPEAREFIFRMLTPRQALEIAVRAEKRAKAFFGEMLAASNDAGVRELAIGLGRDEESHIAWLQDSLLRVPEPFLPCDDCPGDPMTPQAL